MGVTFILIMVNRLLRNMFLLAKDGFDTPESRTVTYGNGPGLQVWGTKTKGGRG